ncbi:hypothetical protein CY34DRAFT_561702 [Suillus luteus UH-Slu-Lm8-n1]|uniref:Uncharacterized protein n=1 Tax=Suillus luteus UH-Slu-Lm8-n1 TaxID=930992 RepID=A0A0D0AN79_9AGAM|nr:hypothetical protein CY34DRAFT_561702 [Suillus luteus UH-Slu-Lm8-n1]
MQIVSASPCQALDRKIRGVPTRMAAADTPIPDIHHPDATFRISVAHGTANPRYSTSPPTLDNLGAKQRRMGIQPTIASKRVHASCSLQTWHLLGEASFRGQVMKVKCRSHR